MTQLINLTPHTLNIINSSGDVVDISTSGIIARCSQENVDVDITNGIKITKQVFGEIVDLPAEKENTSYIVSRLVASACPERKDLLIPGPLVRDEDGKVIGCNGLSIL